MAGYWIHASLGKRAGVVPAIFLSALMVKRPLYALRLVRTKADNAGPMLPPKAAQVALRGAYLALDSAEPSDWIWQHRLRCKQRRQRLAVAAGAVVVDHDADRASRAARIFKPSNSRIPARPTLTNEIQRGGHFSARVRKAHQHVIRQCSAVRL